MTMITPAPTAFRSFATLSVLFSRSSHSFLHSPRRSPPLCFTQKMSSSEKEAAATTKEVISPPVARREEDRVVFAGTSPPGWDPKIPRQSNDSSETLLDPPVAIPDPYGWLRNDARDNEEVLEHLRLENEYSQAMTKHLKHLQDSLYEEFLSSIQETDYTTPRPREGYWYYTRTFKGESYSAYCRAPKTSETFSIDWDRTKDSPIMPGEEIYLNVNELATGKSYCSVGRVKTSHSQKYIAYTVDFSGDEKYEMHVRNLETMEDVALTEIGGDRLLEIDGLVWGHDDETLYYMTMDEQHRPYRLYQRKGWKSDSPTDTLLKEELDDLFWCSCYKSLDGKYIFFDSASKETSEIWYISTEDETSNTEMSCIAKRRNKVLYEVEHGDDSWYVWTNVDGSPNMKLMKTPDKAESAADWELVKDAHGIPLFDGSLAKSLDSVTVLNTHVVIQGREGGIPRIWTFSKDTKSMKMLSFDESSYDVGTLAHFEADTKSVAVSYSSLVTPPTSIDISLDDDSQRTVLKTKAVPGYDKAFYGCDRMVVLSRDGKTKIPISVVYSNETMEKVKAGERVPVHLYGYGSYGACMEASFGATRLPLLKRGMMYVIAHVRGGGEMGRQWYEEPNGGKYLCKKNTFDDFVDVAKFLVEKWTTSDMLSCEGRSAGGLLIGASINQAPSLFKCAILGVPFVDVVVTMTDATIPLTSGEWVEWGNPNTKKYLKYMMEYSPMNNVQKGETYPACWLTGGLHDPRVAYWEPAKFTATLRHANPDNDNPICMKLDLSAGHFSASDRYKYLRELAYDYSFLLDQLNLA